MAPIWKLPSTAHEVIVSEHYQGSSSSDPYQYTGSDSGPSFSTELGLNSPWPACLLMIIFISTLFSELRRFCFGLLICSVFIAIRPILKICSFVRPINMGVQNEPALQDHGIYNLKSTAIYSPSSPETPEPIKTPDIVPRKDRYIPNSPYTDSEHQSDLWSFNWQDACMVLALKEFHAVRKDYAQIPYKVAFNLAEVFESLKSIVGDKYKSFDERRYCIVAFRSQLKDKDVYEDLSELDKAAHAEATKFQIMKYWYGSPDSEKRNLATCFWPSREGAAKASRCPAHLKAVRTGTPMYAWYKVECYEMVISNGLKGWTFEPIEIRGHSKS